MTLVAVAHCADQETGRARLTYDELTERTTLSRAKVSHGLTVLEDRNSSRDEQTVVAATSA